MMKNKYEQNTNSLPYSRRVFLKRVIVISAAGLVVPGLLSACGNENAADRSETETGAAGRTPGENEAVTSVDCEATADLIPADQATRQSVNYVDESPNAEKFCANCRFFKQPATGTTCGGCQIVGGPIAAIGYCNAWVAQS